MEPTIVLLPYDSPEILKCKMNVKTLFYQCEIKEINDSIQIVKNMIKYKLKRLKSKTRIIRPKEKIIYHKIKTILENSGFKSKYIQCFVLYVIDFMKKQNPDIFNLKIATNMWN